MIHRYKSNDKNIVLDVYSGAVHLVSNLVYDLLGVKNIENAKTITELDTALLPYQTQELQEAFLEIKEMQEQGLLFSEDTYQNVYQNFKKSSVVKALCLHVAHDCNLSCAYCFAGTGEYHGKRAMMSLDVGKKAIDFVIDRSGKRRNIEIDFFGGEPLMNFDVVKDIVSYARSREKESGKHFRFTITTNGVLLDDDKIEYINQNMDNVVLSLDGRKETNDKVRSRIDDSGTYESIVPKFQKLVKNRNKDYYVRGTFTKYNLDFSKDVLHLVDLGFQSTSIEPVVAEVSEPYAIKEEDLEIIFAEYDKLAKEYIKRRKNGKPFTFFHFMVDLNQGPCAIKRLSGCGAGCEYLAVTPEGDLYPCHQFVGNEAFKMGSVIDNKLDLAKKQNFEQINVYEKQACRECWAKFYCSGGCSANAYSFHKNLKMPYEIGCEMMKKRLECAIMIEAELQDA